MYYPNTIEFITNDNYYEDNDDYTSFCVIREDKVP